MRIDRNKSHFSVAEFSSLMGVSYNTVRYWILKDRIPNAFQIGDGDITIKRWRIPREALEMEKPKRGGRVTTRSTRAELIERIQELSASFNKLLENHAGLQGRYDELEIKFNSLLAGKAHWTARIEELEAEIARREYP